MTLCKSKHGFTLHPIFKCVHYDPLHPIYQVWLDVVPMDIGSIILGKPWLYDNDVRIQGRTNECSFMFKN